MFIFNRFKGKAVLCCDLFKVYPSELFVIVRVLYCLYTDYNCLI